MSASTRYLLTLAAARGRLLLWVGAIVLLLQLFAAAGHDHELESSLQDCVACTVQAQSQAAPPAPRAEPVASGRALAYIVQPIARAVPAAGVGLRLLPQPHAPPASALAS